MAELEPGVYLNLDQENYFAQDALGSSDFKTLFFEKEGWYWSSRHNPDRVQKATTATNYGSALHAILLEGIDAYERRFLVTPDKGSFPGLVVTVDEMKAKISGLGRTLEGTSKWKAEDWAAAMSSLLPDVPCWLNIMADFNALRGSLDTVTAAEDRALRLMREIAIDPTREDNIAVRRLFAEDSVHPVLAEVSVLAEVDGMRMRWRFDKMLPAADLDLKSLGSWRGRPLAWEIGEAAARNGWTIQRAHYHEGRKIAFDLIRQGRLFGGTLEQRNYIRELAEAGEGGAWIWVAYQKPDDNGKAPVLCPVWDDAGSWLHEVGKRQLTKAKAFYRDAVARWGLDRPWARVETLHFTDENREPRIFFPHWIQNEEPTEEKAYDGTN